MIFIRQAETGLELSHKIKGAKIGVTGQHLIKRQAVAAAVRRAEAGGNRVAQRHDPPLRKRRIERQEEKSKKQKAKSPGMQFNCCKGESGQTRQPLAQEVISHWSFQMDAVHGVLSPIYPDKIPDLNFHLR